MVESYAKQAYDAQLASQRHLALHHLRFRIQHQRWFRFHRDRALVADFEINTDGQRIGLFAELVWLLYALLYSESIGAKPYLRITSSSLSRAGDGETDYLQQFFQPSWPIVPMEQSFMIRKRISSLNQLPGFKKRTEGMTLWRANKLVRTYLPLKADVIDEASSYITAHLGSSYMAVHWRGTDKCLEAEPVNVEAMARHVLNVYQNLQPQPTHLFLASDEQSLIDQLVGRLGVLLPDLRCEWRPQIMRSHDQNPIHLRNDLEAEQRYRLGKDALVDALIMAKSRSLVRTSSFLSAWSSIWNPVLPVYVVNQPYSSRCWFPDSEIQLASNYFHDCLSTSVNT